jgi:hypothetical protein
MIRAALRDLFSGKDNQSLDIGRVLWAAFSLALIGHESLAIVARGQVFDPLSFATACGALLAAGAGALVFKAKTEPGS